MEDFYGLVEPNRNARGRDVLAAFAEDEEKVTAKKEITPLD